MTTYEYHIVQGASLLDAGRLNLLGAEGWRLVSFADCHGHADRYAYVFIREKQAEAQVSKAPTRGRKGGV